MKYALFHHLQQKWIRPKSTGRDLRRQEFILNVLLFGLLGISSVALVTVGIVELLDRNRLGNDSFVALAVFIGLLLVSRRLIIAGKIRTVACLVLILLSAVTGGLLYVWGFTLPQMLLNSAMIIIMAGVLINARAGLVASGCVAVVILLAGSLQVSGTFVPDTKWRTQLPLYSDAVGYALVLAVIGLVSWLSNRETDRALDRARSSEAELTRERDNLEVKVAERTQELERLQLTRILELERFAHFGRISATLVHDMANPLMAASFSLQQLPGAGDHRVKQVSDNLAQVERHLQAARQQLRGQSERSVFSPDQEIRKVLRTLQLRAAVKQVRLVGPARVSRKLYGDPLKFNQIVSNLVTNAIESYDHESGTAASVQVVLITYGKNGFKLIVEDTGRGIPKTDRAHLFEPFFSRRRDGQGAGIGLSIVKQFVEQEFNGSISLRSTLGSGSRFSVILYPAPETAE